MLVASMPRSAARRPRHPDMICWRVSAIYRCCLRYRMSKDWALEKLREISPEGHRDIMAEIWFTDIGQLQDRYAAQKAQTEEKLSLPMAA